MARRHRDDDFDDDDHDDHPPFPGKVRSAGIIWIVLSVFLLFGSCVSYFILPVLLRMGNGDNRPDKYAPSAGEICGFGIGIGIAVAFLVFGIQTVRGSARDTIAGSVLSLVVGALYLLAGVAGVVLSLTGSNVLMGVGVSVLVVALGGLCVLPGILGLSGRASYLKWRRENDPHRRRRREREEYDDDDEDEDDERDRQPRRRRSKPVEVPSISVDCPRCFQTVRLPLASAGSVAPCPKCGNEVDVPASSE